MNDTPTASIVVFISYAHADKKYFEDLQASLAGIVDIQAWSDRELEAGDDWQREIDEALQIADVAVLMVSRAYVASQFIRENEFPYLMGRATEGLQLVWFLLEDCRADMLVHGGRRLDEIQAAVSTAKPIKRLGGANRAAAWTEISHAVEAAAARAARAQQVPPTRRPVAPEPEVGHRMLAFIHTFSGLDPGLEPLEDEDASFQDFVVDEDVEGRGGINNPISYLWADARNKNSVKANIIKGTGPYGDAQGLEIEFSNHPDTWPSNVAIFPQNLRARRPNPRQQQLCLDAQALDVDGREEDLVVTVRVVDEFLRHWVYRLNVYDPEEKRFHLPCDGTWFACQLDLGNGRHWRIFESDGNRSFPPTVPEFNLITSIVLTVGRDSERMAGSGKLRIANVRLRPRSSPTRLTKAK